LNLIGDKTIKNTEKNGREREIPVINNIKTNKQHKGGKEKLQTEQKRMKESESKLNNSLLVNDIAKTSITELQAKLESERKENDNLRKKLNETIRNIKSKDEVILTLRSKLKEVSKAADVVIVNGKSNKDSPGINIKSKVDDTDLDSIGQEIIFRVQIISSDTLLPINSPKLKGLKNLWEYEDGGLHKYTVGNEKDFKSASVLQSELRRMGFVDAFVAAFKNEYQ
jgi:chromosome segregation ATPase